MILYIDPGTGAMLFSLATGLISIIWFALKKLYIKLKFVSFRRKDETTSVIPLVIFSDNKRYWTFYEPVCYELDKRGFDVVYYTESEDDPVFDCTYKHVSAKYIGSGNTAYRKLNFLKATIVLSTTPGLDVYQWRKSREVKYYVYLPHGANAMTSIRMFGLDFYDAILFSGQYQVELVRELERIRNESPKEITIVGVPAMDELEKRIQNSKREFNSKPVVLLAPSWGNSAILSRYGGSIIKELIATGYHLIIRPHPQSFISETTMIEGLMEEFPESEQIEWDRSLDNFDTLNRADIMISDFSGVLFEFSMAFNKPVICLLREFDDSPYDSCWLEDGNWTINTLPKFCEVISDDTIDGIKERIDKCLYDETFKKAREEVRNEVWNYRGEGAKRTADYLIAKYNELVLDKE